MNRQWLSDLLRQKHTAAHVRLRDWPVDDLLRRSIEDVIDQIVRTGSIECPELCATDGHRDEPTEVIKQAQEFGEMRSLRVTRTTVHIPFVGDPQVLRVPPVSHALPKHMTEVRDNEVLLHVDDHGASAEDMTKGVEARLRALEQALENAREEINAHNERLTAELTSLVTKRRGEVSEVRQRHAAIGFPLKPRADAQEFAVPIRRRPVALRKPPPSSTSRGVTPEPFLADADYEAALGVLVNMRNAFERNPTTSVRLGEEAIRDVLLISLNAQFEGKAAGEVFNGAGKTDILIRDGDRNVFIGECKIWEGPKTVTEMLDQLLSYLTWRDTKAALLLFIRNVDVTAVIGKAVAQVKAHPNHVRADGSSTDERHDFVVHANGDPERLIRVALLPFVTVQR